MKVLECSTYKGDISTSKGDKRFSAMCAKVTVNGVFDTIENHYQMSKRFLDEHGNVLAPSSWRDAKGKGDVHHMVVSGQSYETKYLTAYYNLLWVKYLDSEPELVRFASGFDKFSDKFRGKSINCQADVIAKYIKQGRIAITSEPLTAELMKMIKSKK